MSEEQIQLRAKLLNLRIEIEMLNEIKQKTAERILEIEQEIIILEGYLL